MTVPVLVDDVGKLVCCEFLDECRFTVSSRSELCVSVIDRYWFYYGLEFLHSSPEVKWFTWCSVIRVNFESPLSEVNVYGSNQTLVEWVPGVLQ